MTKIQRIKEIAVGIITILIALLILISARDGYNMIMAILSLYFIVRGIGDLIYYFTMSRFMVGGGVALYRGILLLNLGTLAFWVSNVQYYYILIYLIALHAFQGLVKILRALEAKRYGAKSYRLKLAHGLLDLIMAILCIVYMRHIETVVLIYGSGLIYSAVLRIISACRKNRMIFIQ